MGTETSAVAPASHKDFGSRSPMSSLTGIWLASDWPGSPESIPVSKLR